MAKTRTITLTDRAPVRIVEDEWPEIADTSDRAANGDHTVRLGVRQHADGRCLVYGVITNPWANYAPQRSGYLVDGEEVVDAMHRCVEKLAVSAPVPGAPVWDWARLVDEWIADLPAEEI